MKICVIGCGAMGGSMAAQLARHHEVTLYDHDDQKAVALAQEIGAAASEEAPSAIKNCDMIIVAVKPKDLEEAARQFVDHVTQDQIILSVVGSTPLSTLEKVFGQLRIVRTMPNIACAFGKGVLGCVDAESVSPKTRAQVEEGMGCLGTLHWVPEKQIEALTALAGSGPAFAFVIIESMIDAGIEMGLTPELAKDLACEMWEGALTLVQNSGKSPTELKWQVSSPGGVTIAGLHQMEQDAVRSGIMNTLFATYKKSLEIC